MSQELIKSITAEHVEALAGVYLSHRYDSPQPTPDFHRECWALYCSEEPMCAVAAPRNHAKSTALTHDYILAVVLFRTETYVILISASEEMAIEHLADIASELRENEELRRDFKIKDFIQDQKTDIIVECTDGHQFRIVARGAEQKIRGRKWRGRRPGLIVGDDLEDDEQVESKERRAKFSRWFYRACIQALRDGGKIRVHGTILHDDSLLNNIVRPPKDSPYKTWTFKIYRAHRSFDEFTDILWPEKFPEERLRKIRQVFINRVDSAGYSQEYLNDPLDNDDAYLRKDDFLPMSEEDRNADKIIRAAADFAVSTLDSANRTSFTIGGTCERNLLHFVDQRVGRWDYLQIIEEMFLIQKAWKPTEFFVEDGVIWKTIWPTLRKEMQTRNIWINCVPVPSTKDKAVRGRSLQKRMRAHGCRFDKEAEWYAGFEAELLKFTGIGEATLDDQFDSAGLLSRGIEDYSDTESEDFYSEEQEEFEAQVNALRQGGDGRSPVTGY